MPEVDWNQLSGGVEGWSSDPFSFLNDVTLIEITVAFGILCAVFVLAIWFIKSHGLRHSVRDVSILALVGALPVLSNVVLASGAVPSVVAGEYLSLDIALLGLVSYLTTISSLLSLWQACVRLRRRPGRQQQKMAGGCCE